LLPRIERFLAVESASGVILLLAAAIALLWANSPAWRTYEAVWATFSLRFWINNGLMTLFFLVVGLEIRHEIHSGALSQWRAAALPLVAALGGVLAPALIYLALNAGSGQRQGWAVPTATDIAFAVGTVTLLGKRLPSSLRVLLLTLAIADDIAALVIIAVVYSGSAGFEEVSVALGGALVGLLVPVRSQAHSPPGPEHPHHPRASPSKWLRDALHPWVAYCVMPLFALANAGVTLKNLGGTVTDDAWPIALGIGLGLFLGKPLGILLTTWLAVRLRIGALPPGINWRHIIVLGLLGGIGFTMAMFIANLAFVNAENLAVAKLAVLVGSAASAAVGLIVGRLILPEGPRL